MPLLADRTVIVSGIGPGLGRAVAVAAAREGARVVLAARNPAYLDEVADEISGAGGEALPVPTDITDPAACKGLVAQARERMGPIHGLVNNAFSPPRFATFADADFGQWRDVFEVNVFGTLVLTQHVVRRMQEDETEGSIVFVNTMAAKAGMPRQADYAASKGALLAATRTMARELGPDGIRVNSVLPGWMWGPGVQIWCQFVAHEEGITPEEARDEIAARIPLGYIPPDTECAGAVLFFLSDLARPITGQSLDVNGGERFD
ncbi:MAG: SDR family oxidoreductase [Acidimicrobiia bacterium]|nr:SDR family oxidoreductase [Acidimicrobiia bacterium]